MAKAGEAVRRHGRVTPARVAVLARLFAARRALSHADLEAMLGGDLDRVTLYRVLDWLVRQGLAHRIGGEDRIWRYAAAPATDEDPRTHAGHAHFHCVVCARVYCLPDLQPVPASSLPPGFHVHKAELSLHGRCPQCGP